MTEALRRADLTVVLTGAAWSGKTTLAQRLGQRLGARPFAASTISWSAGWWKS